MPSPSSCHLFIIHSFIQEEYSEHLLYVMHCPRGWGFSSDQNPYPHGAYIAKQLI